MKNDSPVPVGNKHSNRLEDIKTRQDIFLKFYSEMGTVRSVCQKIDLDRNTIRYWTVHDVNDFKDKFEECKINFREKLQDIALERVENQGPKDNPILLLSMLNAHYPELYKPQGTNTDETAQEVIKELRNATKLLANESQVIEIVESPETKLEKILKNKKSKI